MVRIDEDDGQESKCKEFPRNAASPPEVGPPGSPLPLAAAQEEFDTSKLWFHGTKSPRNFKTFKAGSGGVNELGRGIYFASDPEIAQAWAGRPGQGGRIIPVFLRKGDVFDLSTRIDFHALAQRIVERNEVTADELLAKKIRSEKDVLSWSPQDQSLINRVSQELWRTWLMEPLEDFASWVKESCRGGDHLNTWLERAGYIGAVNPKSQIAGQIVVFKPSDICSPWDASRLRHEGKSESIHDSAVGGPEPEKAIGVEAEEDGSFDVVVERIRGG